MKYEVVNEREKRDQDVSKICKVCFPTALHPQAEEHASRRRVTATDNRQEKKKLKPSDRLQFLTRIAFNKMITSGVISNVRLKTNVFQKSDKTI